MSTIKGKYLVSNSFETFGTYEQSEYGTQAEADHAARELAQNIAETFFKQDGDKAVIPFYSPHGKTGNSDEIRFHEGLSDDSGAKGDYYDDSAPSEPGRLPWSELRDRILNAAVEVEEIEPEVDCDPEAIHNQICEVVAALPEQDRAAIEAIKQTWYAFGSESSIREFVKQLEPEWGTPRDIAEQYVDAALTNA